jgi:hypothetical protein
MFFQLIFDAGTATPSATGGVSLPLIFLVLLIVLVVAAGIVKLLRGAGKSSNWDALNRQKFTASWKEIEALAKQGSPAGRKLALIEADKLLDHALKSVGFPGETMADRLKVAQYQHPKIKDVWTAHKWRNQLVHEQNFSLSDRQTHEALRAFEAVLRSLKALL